MKGTVLGLLLPLLLLGQEEHAPKFHGEAPLVVLPVAVYDKSGHLVDNIDANDFVVLDDGRPRPAHVDLIGTFELRWRS